MKKFQIIVTVQRQITLSRYIKGGNFEGENHELDTGNDVTFKTKNRLILSIKYNRLKSR